MLWIHKSYSSSCRRWYLLLLLILSAPTNSEKVAINPEGATRFSSQEPNLFLATTWAPLNAIERADLYLAAAGAGKLDDEDNHSLTSAARLIKTGEFPFGNQLVRGAKAIDEIPPSVMCTINKGALISLASVTRRLSRLFVDDDPLLSQEIGSIPSLVLTPTDQRSLLVLLLLRESNRASSPLMPYIMAFLQSAHEHVPSAWDPASPEGVKRRAGLRGVEGGSTLLAAADELRRVVLRNYEAIVPRVMEKLPRLMGVIGPDMVDVKEVFAIQRFVEVWLALRSRSFDDGGHGVLVPLACLMNHPVEGEESNIEIGVDSGGGVVWKAKRYIKRGEQLTYSYGKDLTAERALLVYGFPMSVWSKMPSIEGFYSL